MFSVIIHEKFSKNSKNIYFNVLIFIMIISEEWFKTGDVESSHLFHNGSL